jgi:hypothetical protein
MLKKLIAALLSLLLITATQSPSANSAVKAGSACKKIGSKSTVGKITFTCIKSGKKLVWDKGTNIPAPVVVQPNWLKSYSEISSVSRNNKRKFNLENTVISSNVDRKLAENLLKYQNLVSSYWKSLGFESPYPISVLMLSEKDYPIYAKHALERKISCTNFCTESNWFSPNFSSQFQGTVLVENYFENATGKESPTGLTILYVIGTAVVSKNYNWAPDLATNTTHEYGHLVQFSYLEGWKNFRHMACWNNEGFPSFFEDAFYYENESEKSKINVLTPPSGTYLNWLNTRRTLRENLFKQNTSSAFNAMQLVNSGSDSDWAKFFNFTDVRNSQGCTLVAYGRNHGNIISRLFYEDFGPKAFLDILKNTNEFKSWSKAFLVTTGKEYAAWLKERVFPEFNKI